MGRIATMATTACGIALLLTIPALAYESYHDPFQNDVGYCSDCHPGFGGGQNDTLHELHTGGTDPVTDNCDLCHTGSGRDNPFTMWSVNDNRGCTGCHGRDYGETIEASYRGFPTLGKAKSSGFGLRQHHADAGVIECQDCHDLVPQADIFTEDVAALYYGRDDVSLGGAPVDPCTNEDTANDVDLIGLDNDGDGLYDGDDPDCQAGGPTLTFTGPCPGPVTVTVNGAVPNGSVAVAWAVAQGSFTIPVGTCAGTTIDIANPNLLATVPTDANGDAVLDANAPAAACGVFLQAVDLVACVPTNVTTVN